MRTFLIIFAFIIVSVISIMGFRGSKSIKPPVMIFPDMDFQAKYKAQGRNPFFENSMNDRPLPVGTIARGNALELAEVFSENYLYPVAQNESLYSGKTENGDFYNGFPIEVNNELMSLGQHKYTIYCLPCHGATGDGNGITKQYGMIATASYHDKRLRTMPEGEIFQTITHGKGQMNSQYDKLSATERWAVIAYVRSLQRAHNATIDDVPAQHRKALDL